MRTVFFHRQMYLNSFKNNRCYILHVLTDKGVKSYLNYTLHIAAVFVQRQWKQSVISRRKHICYGKVVIFFSLNKEKKSIISCTEITHSHTFIYYTSVFFIGIIFQVLTHLYPENTLFFVNFHRLRSVLKGSKNV